MNILISIDDTDNLDSPGSGQAAENLAHQLQQMGLAECSGISRHQLLVHADIPYTSHNSAMCFAAAADSDQLDAIIQFSENFLRQESATGSDPGLCVAVTTPELERDALIAFGQMAKKSILTKQAAYDAAKNLGVHLSEHGGTGGGVIGALAAIGLRLQGNDGRFRGWHQFGNAGEVSTVAALCAHASVDAVVNEVGQPLTADTQILFAENMVKTVLLGGAQVVPVAEIAERKNGVLWTTLTRKEVKRF